MLTTRAILLVRILRVLPTPAEAVLTPAAQAQTLEAALATAEAQSPARAAESMSRFEARMNRACEKRHGWVAEVFYRAQVSQIGADEEPKALIRLKD